MSKQERLKKLRKLRDPIGVSLEALDERLSSVEEIDFLTQDDIQTVIDGVRALVRDGEKGDKGDPGNDGESIVGPAGKDGESIVGPAGKNGRDGKDGETPNFDKIVVEVLKLIPKAKNGKSVGVKEVVEKAVEELKKIPSDDGLRLTALEKRLIRLGGGGASFLYQLGDVSIIAPAPTNGQVLTYNAATGKWEPGTNAAGSGINRIIQSVAINTTAGSAALTDYVYFVSGTTTITLPAAAGNGNQYTIKRVGSGTVTVATTGGATIDGSATAPLYVQYVSVDLISDGVNWNVV